jgi:sirohydrochlorin cobaltochelatase
MPSLAPPGLLLFAHGARDPLWARPFEAVAQRVREAQPGTPVTLAFLEFMSPNIATAGASLAAQGCTEVTVLPLFLGAGGHVRKDLPVLLAQLAQQHPGVRWQLAAAVGEMPSVIESMAQAALALLNPSRPAP